MTFVQRTFRDALGLFPTGVAVVTTITREGTRLGTTVSSFNSVSLSPPLVLFSIARSSNSFAFWGEAETYAINILRNTRTHCRRDLLALSQRNGRGSSPSQGRRVLCLSRTRSPHSSARTMLATMAGTI